MKLILHLIQGGICIGGSGWRGPWAAVLCARHIGLALACAARHALCVRTQLPALAAALAAALASHTALEMRLRKGSFKLFLQIQSLGMKLPSLLNPGNAFEFARQQQLFHTANLPLFHNGTTNCRYSYAKILKTAVDSIPTKFQRISRQVSVNIDLKFLFKSIQFLREDINTIVFER